VQARRFSTGPRSLTVRYRAWRMAGEGRIQSLNVTPVALSLWADHDHVTPATTSRSCDVGALPREAFFEGLLGFRARFLNSFQKR
jgi:hypothetical protein